jgi:hypothetical protein
MRPALTTARQFAQPRLRRLSFETASLLQGMLLWAIVAVGSLTLILYGFIAI